MSYSIKLLDKKTNKPVTVPYFIEGGTVQAKVVNGKLVPKGIETAEMDVTYNYSKHYDNIHEDGIRWIYGKTGAEVVPVLERAVALLGTDRDDDYWKPTRGNAGHALAVLLSWARLHPEAVFDGD